MEAIAILSYTRERNIQFLSSIFPVINSDNAQKAVKQLRSTIFPEEAVNDARYLLKAKEMMKKMLSVELKVRPIRTNGEREFSRIK